ncbi:hypothetical protein A2U01_0069947, partial [Trifolium medium]|nr:hypothetical protein [Trifolium medium]
MRTVFEDDWLSYLAKSEQKKLDPDAAVIPEVQLIVGEMDPAKGKRKRRGEVVMASKIPKKDGSPSSQVVDLEAGGSPRPKGTRTLRSRSASATG